MNKKDCVEIGKIGCSLVWVSKDNKRIWRYEIIEKKMYRGSFNFYCKEYLRLFIRNWDKFPMFHHLLINAIDNRNYTSLMWAAYYNNIKLVELFIEKGVDINAKNIYGNTALTWISCNKNIDIAKFLIEKGANVNEKNNYGHTALTCAYINENTELVKLLIEKGAKE